MRLAPARFATTRCPAPSSSQLMRRAVVVLPLVPVITIEPWVRSWVSLVRMRGSIARATSPGSVVPPPRPVKRLHAPFASRPPSTQKERNVRTQLTRERRQVDVESVYRLERPHCGCRIRAGASHPGTRRDLFVEVDARGQRASRGLLHGSVSEEHRVVF